VDVTIRPDGRYIAEESTRGHALRSERLTASGARSGSS
jgi:hypothetical protein